MEYALSILVFSLAAAEPAGVGPGWNPLTAIPLREAVKFRVSAGADDLEILADYTTIDEQAIILRARILELASNDRPDLTVGQVMGAVNVITEELRKINNDVPFISSQVLLRAGMNLAWSSNLNVANNPDLYTFAVAFSLYSLAAEEAYFNLYRISHANNSFYYGFDENGEQIPAPPNPKPYPDLPRVYFHLNKKARDAVVTDMRQIYTEGKIDEATLRKIEATVIAELGADEDVRVIKLDE